jgi:DNA polymerase (family 10)
MKGTECDILSNGSLDIKNKVLKDLDFVLGSVHSHFKQDKETMTKRMINAIHNEYVNAIGHPTGRIIQKRRPYELDLEKVLEVASQQDVAMEINCYPSRLDLKDINCRRAKEYGVKLMLGTDAHDPSGLEFLSLGVFVARRGWLTVKDILNTKNYEVLMKRS